jgi:hypothetical protein
LVAKECPDYGPPLGSVLFVLVEFVCGLGFWLALLGWALAICDVFSDWLRCFYHLAFLY